MSSRFLCFAVCLILLESAPAQDYEGADKLLERLRANEGQALDPAGLLRKQLALFKAESRMLTPEVAARRWLELFDAFVKIPSESLYAQDYNKRLDLDSLIEALPPSTSWAALAAEIDARKPAKNGTNAALKLLVWTLRGMPGDMPEVLANVQSALADNDAWLQQDESEQAAELERLSGELLRRGGKFLDEISAFRKELEIMEKDKASSSNYLSVPELAGVASDAEALLTRVLKCAAELSFSDEPTSKLAAKLVLADPVILGRPQWSLVTSPADAALYETMWKRFPKDEERSDRHRVAGYYIISLITADKLQEARKVLFSEMASPSRDSSDTVISSIDSGDSATVRKTRAFLADLLTAVPELPLWKDYLFLSAQENAIPEVIALMRTAMDRMPENTFLQRATEEALLNSYLATDQIQPAVAMIQTRLKAGPGEIAAMGDLEKAAVQKRLKALGVDVTPELLRNLTKLPGSAEEVVEGHVRLAMKLTTLGRLSKRPEWVNEGLAAALAQVDSLRSNTWSGSAYTDELAVALVENDRGPEAEKLVTGRLMKLKGGSDRSSYEVKSTLAALVYIYRQAERWEDIVKLLDGCDFWGTDDLSKLADVNFKSFSLQLMAAEALAKVGKKDVALQLVQRVIPKYSGNDAVYQLLLALNPPDLETQLDKAYAANRFEERPLIWKAKVQLDSGRTDEADKTIHAAIAIDPSDGEQGKGDRMRAYSVLAEVLEKKGDAEQAKIMRGAVEAIRISEDADDWWGVGLTTRAVKMYQEALDHFADAYCIQSRLALRYSELGDAVNAEKYYQRAFELMPSSFGRVESHCFGCEGIFSGEKSQGVAERVFTRLAKEMPDRAQVFYLLGFLRESQGRMAEALVEFRHAVALDPEYINAWKKIAELAEADLSSKERDDASFALFRLGAGNNSLDKVINLPGLWDAVLGLELTLPQPLSGPVYRLAASDADPRQNQSDVDGSRIPEAMRKQITSNDIIEGVSRVMQLLLHQR